MPTAAPVDEKIVERMKKLHKHAKSASNIGNQEEANAFMSKLQEMLAKHKMDMSEIEYDEENREPCVNVIFWPENYKIEVKSTTCVPRWLGILGQIVGRSHACSVAAIRGTNRIVIHGKAADAQLACDALGYLGRAGMRLAMRSYRPVLEAAKFTGNREVTRGYKSSFLLGFVTRIENRLAEDRTKLETSNSTGLMRINQDLIRAEDSMKASMHLCETDVKTEVLNGYAYMEGVKEADKQQIRPSGSLTA